MVKLILKKLDLVNTVLKIVLLKYFIQSCHNATNLSTNQPLEESQNSYQIKANQN